MASWQENTFMVICTLPSCSQDASRILLKCFQGASSNFAVYYNCSYTEGADIPPFIHKAKSICSDFKTKSCTRTKNLQAIFHPNCQVCVPETRRKHKRHAYKIGYIEVVTVLEDERHFFVQLEIELQTQQNSSADCRQIF